MLKTVALSIRDFALPVPRRGSIELHSGYSRASQEGIELHQKIQTKNAEEHPDYQSEVSISRSFEKGPYLFEISGRMDGIFLEDPPIIEEIKSTFNLWELYRKLQDAPLDHPYCLQLRTYGYFYWLNQQTKPNLSFHLVSSRNSETKQIDLSLDIPSYERWLNVRLEELVSEAKLAERRSERRKQMSKSFAFPFDHPRPGQIDLISSIETGMQQKKPMLVQAPTGLGKTAGVLYPSLKEALSRGQRVVYVTPKNSQHSVAEDAIERFQDTGTPVRSLTLTAKSKICFKNEPICNPDFCEYAKDYYTKVAENDLIAQISRKKKLTSRTFKKLGEEYQVCPFELQIDAAPQADTIICDYNYVFAPSSALGRQNTLAIEQQGKPNLVIDEAHNLMNRAMEYYSPALSSIALEKMRDAIRELPKRFAADAEDLLDECLQVILSSRPDGAVKSVKITPKVTPLIEQDSRLRAFLSKYLESDVEIQPKDVILRLSFYWSEFTSALEYVSHPEHPEFFTTFQPHPTGGVIKITCCDASKMLKSCYDDYEQVVGFSATLKPFGYYAKLSGLDFSKTLTAEFQSPFPAQNRKLLIIPQISTKYSDRERSYPRVAEVIRRVTQIKKGNYFAFFPSFDFLEKTLSCFESPQGFTILKQERDMKLSQVEAILEHLKNADTPTIIFAVQGGVFSEGVDYPGKMVIGAFVIGPPLPSFDLEREEMKHYYQKCYQAGFDYAYTYPAMSKAIQAAGRVIRSEKDQGIIVLIDQRFLLPSYSQSMPSNWFKDSPRELVPTRILREVQDFWDKSAT